MRTNGRRKEEEYPGATVQENGGGSLKGGRCGQNEDSLIKY
jgi:hypothetical protein